MHKFFSLLMLILFITDIRASFKVSPRVVEMSWGAWLLASSLTEVKEGSLKALVEAVLVSVIESDIIVAANVF